MVDYEDRRKKQVLGDRKTRKIKLDMKHHFHFFFFSPDLKAKKEAYSLWREGFEDENAKLGISD